MLEKFLLKNMGKIALFFGGIVFFTWLFQYLNIPQLNPLQVPGLKYYRFEGIISTFQMFTTLGALFAFWYGYKKYERDKELELIEKYGKKYDKIKNHYCKNEKTNSNLDQYINSLFNLWREEYYLYSKNYINEKLWLLWEKYIIRELNKLITCTSKGEIDNKILIRQIINNEIVIRDIEFNNYLNDKYNYIYLNNTKIISYILKKFNFKNNIELENSLDKESKKYFHKIIQDLNIEKSNNIEHLENLNQDSLQEILKTKLRENSFLKKLIITP